MVLMMDFEGSSIVEKAEADPFAKVIFPDSQLLFHICSMQLMTCLCVQLRSDGEQLQLSKVLDAACK